MPATIIPGFYNVQYGLLYSGKSELNAPKPAPLYLTNNGEGKQLTVKAPTGELSQEWNIQPALKDCDSKYFIITPALSKEILAVSQDVPKSPGEVSLIKNLQVWSFEAVPGREADHLYEIQSNLYTGILGTDPLLGVSKEGQKVIMEFIPVIPNPPPRPVWTLLGPINKK